MTQPPTPGVAWPFWTRLNQACDDLGLSMQDLADKSGIRRATIYELRYTTKPPAARIVNALARTAKIPLTEARRLAGRTAQEDGLTVRAVVESSDEFSDAQRAELLALIDQFEAGRDT